MSATLPVKWREPDKKAMPPLFPKLGGLRLGALAGLRRGAEYGGGGCRPSCYREV